MTNTSAALVGQLVTVVASVFPRMHNVIDANTHHVGHVINTERGYVAYAQVGAEDWELGVTETLDSSVRLVAQGPVEWPTVDQDPDVQTTSGDLSDTVQEARGWLADCGWPGDTASPVSVVLAVLDTHYDGGLGEFALNTVML